jgi:hypothetical protein
LLPDFYSGATGLSGRLSGGLFLRRLQIAQFDAETAILVIVIAPETN